MRVLISAIPSAVMMQEYDLEAFVDWDREPDAFLDVLTEPLFEQHEGDVHPGVRMGSAYLSATLSADTLEDAVAKLGGIAQRFGLTIDHIRFYPMGDTPLPETLSRQAA